MPLMNCLCGTSGVNDVNKGCPVHGQAAQLNLRWVQTDELEQDDPAGMIVVGTEEFSDYRVLAQEVDKDIGEMIVHDVGLFDEMLAALRAAMFAMGAHGPCHRHDCNDCCRTWKQLNAVIAKAEKPAME